MNRVQINDYLIEFDGQTRIERGPSRKVAVATELLLSDEWTAKHYRVGGPDAANQTIVLGQPMTYYDWLSDYGWYVYHLEPDEDLGERWIEKGFYLDEAEAESVAISML